MVAHARKMVSIFELFFLGLTGKAGILMKMFSNENAHVTQKIV